MAVEVSWSLGESHQREGRHFWQDGVKVPEIGEKQVTARLDPRCQVEVSARDNIGPDCRGT